MKKVLTQIALFDFDGTLSQGYISMEFLYWLTEQNIYPQELCRQQKDLAQGNKEGRVSYEDWCDQWGILWAKGLAGQKVSVVEKAAKDFFEKFKVNIYPSSYKLIQLIKSRGFRTMQVSTAAFEVTSLAEKELAIDETHSTQVGTENGVYTDQLLTKFHMPIGKKEFIEKLITCGEYDMSTSMAFGDSIHDAAMLEKAKFPIALNPTKELADLARKNNWLILNHHNVVNRINKLL
jgi:HAD superfamily phosphoserine phosphatase-like hydrolase